VVQPPEAVDRLRDRGGAVRGVVGLAGNTQGAVPAQGGHGLRERVGGAARDHHTATLGNDTVRDRETYPSAGAGDQGDTASEPLRGAGPVLLAGLVAGASGDVVVSHTSSVPSGRFVRAP